MNQFLNTLQSNPEKICREIEQMLQLSMKKLNRNGVVIGLSGGLDSAVTATLAVRAFGKQNVHLYNLPEKDSKSIHKVHAKKFAQYLGLNLKQKSISPILRKVGSYKILPLRYFPSQKIRARLVEFGKTKFLKDKGKDLLVLRMQSQSNSWVAKGIAYSMAKHRIRMVMLYKYAEIRNLMVVGAANLTEWMTGTFSKWGVDHCADVMPIIHLYRTQVEQIAGYLKIPDYILSKPADPDIMPGIPDKGVLLGGFLKIDQILYDIKNRKGKKVLHEKYGKEIIQKVYFLMESSQHMRSPPYSVEIPH